MKPLRRRLEESRSQGLPWEALERDYVLSWLLAGLASHDELESTLVFKGGSCLRKCYGQDRFSEDLDFSTQGSAPQGDDLENAINAAARIAEKMVRPFAPVKLEVERYEEKKPHPEKQEAFTVRATLPWHRNNYQTRVKIEVSRQEKLLWAPEKRALVHPYGEPLESRPLTYAPEEIIAEKLRAILQHAQRHATRGWSRSRGRDFYDLWCLLLQTEPVPIRDSPERFTILLHEKCLSKDVDFEGPETFFPPGIIDNVRRTWESSLGSVVNKLPSFDEVKLGLRETLEGLLISTTA